MRKQLILFLATIATLIASCNKDYYDYLGEENIYAFQKNDTLIYKGTTRNDTFIVARKEIDMLISDKKNHFERLKVRVNEITHDCSGELYDYCWGMSVSRQGKAVTHIDFRNTGFYLTNQVTSFYSSIISYQIGQNNINDVYVIIFETPVLIPNKDIKKMYYSHKYGIIAYEVGNGEIFELDESSFSKES